MIGTSIGHYEILEQLGSGGMGVVYTAKDTQLDRVVALKFLPGHLSKDEDSKRRFIQEAKAASALDHANICTIHHIGETDEGAVYIVMSYYEGQTLKYMMSDGALPEENTLSIARQIASGLARAHAAGIVHRDIKPANVMVTNHGEVKILDFGIAKLGESSDLTQQGSTLGTVAYMSPEQARGETVGATADLWSLGVLMYEMLAGKRPFDATYDQALLYAILNESGTDIADAAPDVSAETAELVRSLLSKSADDRPQNASDVLSAMGVATGTVYTGTGFPNSQARVREPTSMMRIAMLFAGGGVLGLALVYAAMMLFGLPDWVFPLGVLLLLAGAPVTLYATRLEKQRAKMESGERKSLSGLASWLTPKKALMGGVFALAALGLVSAGFMGMRALGIGPAATLITSGAMSSDDVIIVADFADQTSVGNMGAPVAEALRVDLSQSDVVSLLDDAVVRASIGRMDMPTDTTITSDIAREVAVREGAKAALFGDISSLGSSYVISLRLVEARSGEELVSLRETAKTDADVVDAVDQLSASFREQVGESLIAIRDSAPLEQVTTSSLDALRLYTLAVEAKNRDDADAGLTYAVEATEIDPEFAMAYRIMAAMENNRHGSTSKMIEYARKAYENLDRLTRIERYFAEDAYYTWVERGYVRRAPSMEARLKENPDDAYAANLLHLVHRYSGDVPKSLEYSHEVIRIDPTNTLGYVNSYYAYTMTKEWDKAQAMLDSIAVIEPNFAGMSYMDGALFAERTGNYVAAVDTFKAALENYTDLGEGFFLANYLVSLHLMLGQHAEAEKMLERSHDINRQMGSLDGVLEQHVTFAATRFLADGDREKADAEIDRAYAMVDPSSLDTLARGYLSRGYALAILGRNDDARAVVDEQARFVPANWLLEDDTKNLTEGLVALNEGRYDEAIEKIKWVRKNLNTVPRLYEYELATALRAAGQIEEATEVLEAATTGTSWEGLMFDQGTSTLAFRSLGEVYDEMGRTDDAIAAYQSFVDRWANADAHLQLQVDEVRKRIDALIARKATEN